MVRDQSVRVGMDDGGCEGFFSILDRRPSCDSKKGIYSLQSLGNGRVCWGVNFVSPYLAGHRARCCYESTILCGMMLRKTSKAQEGKEDPRWATFRRARRAWVAAFVFYPFSGIVMFYLSISLLPDHWFWPAGVFSVLYFGMLWRLTLRFLLWPCPRCGMVFRGYRISFPPKECYYCKLPFGAPIDPS